MKPELTPEELQAIADDTQNLAHGEPKGQTISEVFKLPPGSFTAYREAVEASGMSAEEYAMTHSAVEVHSKETMDEVREALEDAAEIAEGMCARYESKKFRDALAKLNPPL